MPGQAENSPKNQDPALPVDGGLGAELVQRFRAGELEALDEVYRCLADRVFATARRIVGSAADAEDVTQEAFLKGFQQAHKFRGERGLGSWLLRIAVHEAINFCRKRERRQRDQGGAEPDQLLSRGPRPLEVAQAAEERAALDRALLELPLEQRAVVVLREISGLSYAEISALLDVPEGTVTSRLVRGRERLAAALHRAFPEQKPGPLRDGATPPACPEE